MKLEDIILIKPLASTIVGKASDDVGRWGIEQDLNELLNAKVDSLSHFILNNGKKNSCI